MNILRLCQSFIFLYIKLFIYYCTHDNIIINKSMYSAIPWPRLDISNIQVKFPTHPNRIPIFYYSERITMNIIRYATGKTNYNTRSFARNARKNNYCDDATSSINSNSNNTNISNSNELKSSQQSISMKK